MIDNMPEKTGKSLGEWKKILNTKSFEKHSEGVKYLKSEYNVTHGFANTIVTLSKEDDNTSEDLVESQYRGKEDLIPIYEKLIMYLKSLGSDVIITPKKGSVSKLTDWSATSTTLVGGVMIDRLANTCPPEVTAWNIRRPKVTALICCAVPTSTEFQLSPRSME